MDIKVTVQNGHYVPLLFVLLSWKSKNVYRHSMSTTVTLCLDIVYVDFELAVMKVLSFNSRSNGLINFRSNGLQVVALMSVLFRYFVLSIRSNVFRRERLLLLYFKIYIYWLCRTSIEIRMGSFFFGIKYIWCIATKCKCKTKAQRSVYLDNKLFKGRMLW